MSDLAARIAAARSFLFVPGDRLKWLEKAFESGADAVVLDLEDAIAPDAKDAARAAVGERLAEPHEAALLLVRINDPRGGVGASDVATLAPQGVPLMVPKAEDPSVLVELARRTGAPVIPLIESALGLVDPVTIARTAGVARIALGHLDLAADLGVDPDADDVLAAARSSLLVASIAAGLPAPIDGVSTEVRDTERVTSDTRAARRRGYTGRLCIHPAQVPIVHVGLAPTDDEIAWAEGVVEAASSGLVAVLDGRMIDRPVVLRAESILARRCTNAT
ncbi:HpcH/HpaI aldolase/citrate lyase family protein [Aeromicrobium sp. CF4.19]|uniref:HpcH/HpaI aldolase/citrate lyase family protein n=1 Tax=Aeromicrobium sp. CF4.19 TaxID=3373082 RepID=UPI003EE54413